VHLGKHLTRIGLITLIHVTLSKRRSRFFAMLRMTHELTHVVPRGTDSNDGQADLAKDSRDRIIPTGNEASSRWRQGASADIRQLQDCLAPKYRRLLAELMLTISRLKSRLGRDGIGAIPIPPRWPTMCNDRTGESCGPSWSVKAQDHGMKPGGRCLYQGPRGWSWDDVLTTGQARSMPSRMRVRLASTSPPLVLVGSAGRRGRARVRLWASAPQPSHPPDLKNLKGQPDRNAYPRLARLLSSVLGFAPMSERTYNPQQIEVKWQRKWTEQQTFRVTKNSSRPKFYCWRCSPTLADPMAMCVTMPSGTCWHGSRRCAPQCLHPMGWSLRLPAESGDRKGRAPASGTENIST